VVGLCQRGYEDFWPVSKVCSGYSPIDNGNQGDLPIKWLLNQHIFTAYDRPVKQEVGSVLSADLITAASLIRCTVVLTVIKYSYSDNYSRVLCSYYCVYVCVVAYETAC